MKPLRRIASSIAAIAIMGSIHVGAVQAQTAETAETVDVDDCACVVPGGIAGQVIGSISSVTGTVLVSAPAGFSPAAPGSPLSSGSQIKVGPQSTAEIQIGRNCRLEIEENRDVTLVALNGDLCVWVKDATGQTTAGRGAGAAIAGLAVVGVPLAILAISP